MLLHAALFFLTFPLPSHHGVAYQTRILSCSEMQPSTFPRIVGT